MTQASVVNPLQEALISLNICDEMLDADAGLDQPVLSVRDKIFLEAIRAMAWSNLAVLTQGQALNLTSASPENPLERTAKLAFGDRHD